MNFKEKYSSFKHIRPLILWNSGEYTIEKNISRPDDTAFKLKDIQKNTIDKQEIKEVINRVCKETKAELTKIKLLLEFGLE